MVLDGVHRLYMPANLVIVNLVGWCMPSSFVGWRGQLNVESGEYRCHVVLRQANRGQKEPLADRNIVAAVR